MLWDVLIKDKKHILVEIKSSVSRSDVAVLKRIGQLYEEMEGVKVHLLLIPPFMDEKVKVLAENLEIDFYTTIEEATKHFKDMHII